MKRSTWPLGLAAGTALALAPIMQAYAQNSVALYGVIDAGIGYSNNVAPALGGVGGHKFQLTSGVGSGSRFGLRGTEDLGGGNAAIFVLENGFSVANGTMLQGSRLFGRQAYVGLSSACAGSVTFGRQYDSVVDFVSPFTSAKQWGTQYGAHVGDADNLYNAFRINNALKYTSRTWRGVTLGALYGFSNQAAGGGGTGFGNDRAWSVGASYRMGGFSAGAGYLLVSNPSSGNAGGTNVSGAVAGDYTGATNIFYARPVARQAIVAAGAAYQFGQATAGLVYSHSKLDYTDRSSFGIHNIEANLSWRLQPALVTGIAAIYSDGFVDGARGITNVATTTHPRWLQINVGTDYSVSKRTDLYAAVVWQKAEGGAAVAAIDAVGGPTGAGGRYQIATQIGLRTKF
jgi:predicted porin